MATRAAIRDSLLRYLLNPGAGRVLAISGQWGSGKTHLWREVAETLRQQGASVVYASLFGVSAIEDLRGALLTDAFANAAQDEKTKLGSMWAATKKRAIEQLPTILQVLDNKIGAPILARVVDPTALLPTNSYICLDDLERAADALPISDILGFANLLAERRSARVVLIYNDDHIRSRAADFSQLSRAYRERVVRHTFHLSSDVALIGRSIPEHEYSNLPKADRENIIKFLKRAECVNLRTLFRAFERVAEVRRILGEHTRPTHIAFIVALTIEETEGKLQQSAFYDFSPITLIFARQFSSGGPQDPSGEQRSSFHARYYSQGSPEYAYSPGIHRLISEGWVEAQELYEEIVPQFNAAAGPVLDLLIDLGSFQMFYFSDSEHEDWLRRAHDVLSSRSPINASQAFQIYSRCRLASTQLGRAVPPQTLDLIRDVMITAARAGDASIERSFKHSIPNQDQEGIALLEAYDQELRSVMKANLVQEMLEAVWSTDTQRFQELLRSERPHSMLLALQVPVLEELHLTRQKARPFYFNILLAIAREARESNYKNITDRLREYLCVTLIFERLDQSDIYRINLMDEYL